MAGLASRFKTAGITTPKMLQAVSGRPMLSWAIDGLPKNVDNYIAICLRTHVEEFKLDEHLRQLLPGAIEIVVLDRPTEGQAATVLAARHLIDNNLQLWIHNIDTYFRCNADVNLMVPPDAAGSILYFKASDPSLSYVEMDDQRIIRRIAEKDPISPYGTAGLYCFAHGSDFVLAADAMMHKGRRVRGEFYVGPVFNEIISAGGKIVGIPAEEVWDLGTPEKIAVFESHLNAQSGEWQIG
jgi:dTDP-glucose pyrophosphorylase